MGRRIKQIQNGLKLFFVRVVLHRAAIPLVLTFTYIFAVGITSLVMKLLRLRPASAPALSKESFWLEARGYEPDLSDCRRQS